MFPVLCKTAAMLPKMTPSTGTKIVKDMKSVIDHAEQQCRQHGVRMTAKRKLVLTGLLQSERALTAYELADYCRDEGGEALPVMSVYRILKFLESVQLAHKLKQANRYVACVHITCSHRHTVPQFLICVQCQRVKEISVNQSTFATMRRNVAEAGFKMVNPQLEVDCLCENCTKH